MSCRKKEDHKFTIERNGKWYCCFCGRPHDYRNDKERQIDAGLSKHLHGEKQRLKIIRLQGLDDGKYNQHILSRDKAIEDMIEREYDEIWWQLP